ncbi:MAG: acetolactate decarboxylase [Cyanobacteria bacterium HKST-UBA03]|nr:acetolactate decarboxylase [Cyanobacteria bacterium HKST-UBA03]
MHLTQFGTFDAVYNRGYDGWAPLNEFTQSCTMGIGTFHALNGELVAFDNQYFHCTQGVCRPAQQTDQLAWAAGISNVDNVQILTVRISDPLFGDTLLQHALPEGVTEAAFMQRLWGLRMDGQFSLLTLTSTKPQHAPYPSIKTVIETSDRYEHQHLEATLIGFHAPSWMGGLKQAGFHWHGVDKHRQIGGHVLAFTIEKATLQLYPLSGLRCHLPPHVMPTA